MERILFSKVLNEIFTAPTTKDKVDILKANNTLPVRQLLAAAFDPKIVFDVKIPSFRENAETDGYSANNIYVEHRRLYIFMNTYKDISPERKSTLLAQILESIDRSDALALLDVINKDLAKYGLTKEIINEAFPGLIK
jgi:hypothetical protein